MSERSPSKRQRRVAFADPGAASALAEAASAPAAADAETEQPHPWERDAARFVRAGDVVRLRFVSSVAELPDGSTAEYIPEYLNQIFEEEAIALPAAQRPLRIQIIYGASDLRLHLRASRPMEGAVEDAMYALAAELPAAEADASSLVSGAHPEPSNYGEVVSTYELGAGVGGGKFEVRCGYLAKLPELAALNERLQSLMRFYIDGHSPIDPTEERWRLFTAWEVPASAEGAPASPAQPRRLVAGGTTFLFQRWVDSAPRLVVKVCQVLVAPPFQRAGHGSRLLGAVHDFARINGAVEVTVEDPSPGFRQLRDLADLRSSAAKGLIAPTSADQVTTAHPRTPNNTPPINTHTTTNPSTHPQQ